ncbi:MAG: metallophosphoesterase family protein [Betaproteobacteria bacterium]
MPVVIATDNRPQKTDNSPRPAAGRSCPPHYGYSPRVLAQPAQLDAEVVYVIGGLYGNLQALDAIDAMARAERRPPVRVFNGDFHWFDADAAWFAEVQRRVTAHVALRGNVETELAYDDDTAGCGCAYPESVPDDDVERSNRILARLRRVARAQPCAVDRLAALPMHLVAAVGGLRIGLVHGDAWSLAGWRFAHDALHAPESADALERAFALAAVDGFACSHTCAPALAATGSGFVINNGAAGMANFAGGRFGVATRIAAQPLPAALDAARLYGLYERGVWIDALRVDFDHAAFVARFDAVWPDGSEAAVSYRRRITYGPAYSIDHALGRVAASCAALAEH